MGGQMPGAGAGVAGPAEAVALVPDAEVEDEAPEVGVGDFSGLAAAPLEQRNSSLAFLSESNCLWRPIAIPTGMEEPIKVLC